MAGLQALRFLAGLFRQGKGSRELANAGLP